MRGLLFSMADSTEPTILFAGLGSLFVVVLFSLFVFTSNYRVIALALASMFLLTLGMGGDSPVFRWVYENNLIPGIHNFRMMFPYIAISIIGFSLVSGFSLDYLMELKTKELPAKLSTLLVPLAVVIISYKAYYVSDIPIENYLFPMLGLSVLALYLFGLLPSLVDIRIVLLVMLILELIMLRLIPYNAVDKEIVRDGSIAEVIRNSNNYVEGDKVYSKTSAWKLIFSSPYADDLDHRAAKMNDSLMASINTYHGVPSIQGQFALQLGRQELAMEFIESEVKNKSKANFGAQIMDRLSIKYIVANQGRSFKNLKYLYTKERNQYQSL